MDIKELHKKFLECSHVSIDTRKITVGSMFIAIKGDRYDANTFAAEAIEKGASIVVIDNPEYFIDSRTIVVKDSLSTLQHLAGFHREYLNLPIIALTGSNGKTTTKELIQSVLAKKLRAKATVGNLNNHIGVPLTLLSFNQDTEVGIVEMGANHQNEIEFLCNLAKPDYGYITNFGKAHLEGFGGTEGVIKGKSEMYDYLRSNGKTAFVNLNDAVQTERTLGFNRITFGLKVNANTQIDSVSAEPFVKIEYSGITIRSHLIGLYNSSNINAAIAIGQYFGIPHISIKAAIENYIPENNRSQIVTKGTNEIILDAYNANPSSMEAAIVNFRQLSKSGKIAFLGDMFELGNESLSEHQNLIDGLSNDKDVEYYLVGKDFYANRIDRDHLHFFETFESMQEILKMRHFTAKMILIKGSRGMALERVLEFL